MKLSLIALFSISSIIAFAQAEWEQLDGNVTESERQAFELLGQNGTSQIAVAQTNDYLKINVVSDTMYVASLCLCLENEKTIVLHASAALGNVNYKSDPNGSWISSDNFDWQMREKDMSNETIELRKAHLDKFGWVANTLGMGSGREAEFIISKSLLKGSTVSLAAGLMSKSDPENIIPLPAETSGDCAAFSLVAGPPETSYRFNPEEWYQINLSQQDK